MVSLGPAIELHLLEIVWKFAKKEEIVMEPVLAEVPWMIPTSKLGRVPGSIVSFNSSICRVFLCYVGNSFPSSYGSL